MKLLQMTIHFFHSPISTSSPCIILSAVALFSISYIGIELHRIRIFNRKHTQLRHNLEALSVATHKISTELRYIHQELQTNPLHVPQIDQPDVANTFQPLEGLLRLKKQKSYLIIKPNTSKPQYEQFPLNTNICHN